MVNVCRLKALGPRVSHTLLVETFMNRELRWFLGDDQRMWINVSATELND